MLLHIIKKNRITIYEDLEMIQNFEKTSEKMYAHSRII
jgi:hypothetical protein